MSEMAVQDGDEVLLSLVDALRCRERRSQAMQLRVAVWFALTHGPATVDGPRPVLPGREQLVALGGRGTPFVAEFAPADFAARLGRSPYSGARLIADALDLAYRLPCLWARVQGLEVEASYAREVARRTRDLPREQAAYVDQQVAEEADGRLPWSRFMDLIDATIITADRAAAERREREAGNRLLASPTRSSEYGMRGFFVHAPFPVIARLDATVAYLAQALADFGDRTGLDERRVKAVLILANPSKAVQLLRAYASWRAQQQRQSAPPDSAIAAVAVPESDLDSRLHPIPADREPPDLPSGEAVGDEWLSRPDRELPTVADPERDAPRPAPADREPSALADPGIDGAQDFNPADITPSPINPPTVNDADLLPVVRLFVHLSQATLENDCTGVARVEGQPPISARWVKEHFGGCRVTVTPVLDLAHQIPVDAWEIPVRHRHAVHLMTPADAFPFATNTARGKQIDHTIPYDPTGPPGQSRIGNYGPMTVLHHRLKTHGGWQVVQPFPGIYLWRDPTGTATYLVDHTGTRRVPLIPARRAGMPP